MFLVKAFEILPCPPYYFPVSVFIIVPLSVDTPSSGVFSSSAHGALYERSSPGMDGVGRPERHHPVASSRTARRPSLPLLPPNKPVTTVIFVSMSVANQQSVFPEVSRAQHQGVCRIIPPLLCVPDAQESALLCG